MKPDLLFNCAANRGWRCFQIVFALASLLARFDAGAAELPADIRRQLEACNVDWNSPGPTSAASMPIGNGDIGLNVWVETNGDLLFYIGKTDAWGENVRADDGALLKLGGIRLSLSPNPLTRGTNFLQSLKLLTGEIQIIEGAARLRVWVDANHPIIRVEVENPEPLNCTVTLNNWRPPGEKDVTMAGLVNQLLWYHRNNARGDDAVANLTCGAVIRGAGWLNRNDQTLVSHLPGARQTISIYPLTAQTATPEEWVAQATQQADELGRLELEKTRAAHDDWWNQFWQRSWVFVQGDLMAANITKSYVLQRFVTACGGRGAYPIKFNGSIFVVDNPRFPQSQGATKPVTADFRTWGGQYWFQNTRCMYWPRLAAGDFDLMQPLFKMYLGMLSNNAVQINRYYGHGGSYFDEVSRFWGGVSYAGPDVRPGYHGQYFTGILELSMMMLDYYDYTGDRQFAREMLLPMAAEGLKFFDQHFPRDASGKLVLTDVNAIETYWKVFNPAPDIAGLQAVLAGLLALPDDILTSTARTNWQRFAREIPPLPVGEKQGKRVLLPYTGEQTAPSRNGENPELYAIFPFRIYTLEKPDLQLARDSFTGRKSKQKGCWVQDPIQAALLGFADIAKDYVCFNLTRSDPQLKFPAFWVKGNDYVPDEDNGGNGENGLQLMLLQAEGAKIYLLPAWPKDWNADFKLNAPRRTTIQGKVRAGKLADLIVTPSSRSADVVDLSNR